MKGKRQVKEGFLSLEIVETCMCAFQMVNGQEKM
jgi:hypothetical protein